MVVADTPLCNTNLPPSGESCCECHIHTENDHQKTCFSRPPKQAFLPEKIPPFPLGNLYGLSVHLLGGVENSEIVAAVELESGKQASLVVDSRYKKQSISRQILSADPSRKWGVCKCLTVRVSSDVAVNKSLEYKKAFFSGLVTCGSPWTCPVCAVKITNRRMRLELQPATSQHKANGGFLYMMTPTFSHNRRDGLAVTLGVDKERKTGLRGALRLFRNSKGYKKIMKEIGYIGLVRAFEITWSPNNGWHPHTHELLFTTKQIPKAMLSKIQSELFMLWKEACRKAGLDLPSEKHGLKITEAHSAAEYMQKWGKNPKWGVEAEITKANVKRGRSGSMTPFDFLQAIGDGKDQDGRYAALWREFADATYRMAQLFWTPGLKKRFGISELTDKQVVDRNEERAVVVAFIDALTWRLVVNKQVDHRAHVLSLAESGGGEAVYAFLEKLKMRSSMGGVG